MLYYIARLLDLHRPEAEEIVKDAIDAVESNGKILRAMSALFPLADSLVSLAISHGFHPEALTQEPTGHDNRKMAVQDSAELFRRRGDE
jgi:hypothetical protein